MAGPEFVKTKHSGVCEKHFFSYCDVEYRETWKKQLQKGFKKY